MFKLVQVRNGVTETLKDSNSHLDKTFTNSVVASKMAKELNTYLLLGAAKWKIESL